MGGSEPCGGRLKIRAARLINPSHAKLPKMTRPPSEEYRKGLIYAFSCYLLWGLFPLYWFPITHSGMGADQILAQRICWSAVFSSAVLLLMRQAGPLLRAVRDRRLLLAFVCSAAAISVNWLVYLWAITHDHVLDASLGYFIAPLVNVLLGRIFFKEKLGFVQIAAVLLAVTGILWLAVPAGRLPWVSLLLAASFGVYGLLRKLALLDALSGMTLETLLMLPFGFGVRRSWRRTHGGADWFGCGNGRPLIDVRGGGQTDCLGRFGHDSVHFTVDTVFPRADPVRRSVQHAAFCRLSLGVAGRGGLCIRCGSNGEKTQ